MSRKGPTKWFKTFQISTWLGDDIATASNVDKLRGGHGKLIVMHQCGSDKKALIGQLKTMISGLEDGFDSFAG